MARAGGRPTARPVPSGIITGTAVRGQARDGGRRGSPPWATVGRGRPERADETPLAGPRSVPGPRDAPGSRGRLRVALVSGPRLVSETIRETLSARGFEVVRAPVPRGARDLRELTGRLTAMRPAVGLVISDLVDAVEVREITGLLSRVGLRWLIVTGEPAGPRWGEVLEAGAAAVLPMSASVEDLRRALLRLAMGRAVMPADLSAQVVEEWHAIRETEIELAGRMQSLTPRELAVLERLSEGHTVKEIAEQVGVTEGTVRSQVKSVLRKLGVRSQLAGVAAYRLLAELRRGRRSWRG